MSITFFLFYAGLDHIRLSRRGLYSTRVKSEAWSMIFLLISEGETQGLLSAIVKWREIEVQLFIQDAVKHMPNDWQVLAAGLCPYFVDIALGFLILCLTARAQSIYARHSRNFRTIPNSR